MYELLKFLTLTFGIFLYYGGREGEATEADDSVSSPLTSTVLKNLTAYYICMASTSHSPASLATSSHKRILNVLFLYPISQF